MSKRQMMVIARRAADLAVDLTDPADRLADDRMEYYKEYLDQLETGDDECLKGWIRSLIKEGVQEAVEIRKLWLKAQLAA